MTLDEARKQIYRYSDSYSACGDVLRLLDCLDRDEWLTLIGEEWTRFDNIRLHLPELRKVLGTSGPLPQMMTAEEYAAYDALGNTVTCYRGCDKSYLQGASWSLDRSVANCFPFTNRYRVPNPVLVTAQVKKSGILALKFARNESEIITFSARRLKVEQANEDLADAYHVAKHQELLAI